MLARAWYTKSIWLVLLRPISYLFGLLSSRRRTVQQKSAQPVGCPVVVVGNIAVGGSGKTPLLLALIDICRELGLRPGVVSRGYGGKANAYPFDVVQGCDPKLSGDEPAMIAMRTGAPIIVDPDRVSAAKRLLELYNVDIILSDDGLQHYRLARDFEIAVIDAHRGLGNGRLLPEGPLRESPSRLAEVDLVVLNGTDIDGAFRYPNALRYRLKPRVLKNLKTGEEIAPTPEALGAFSVNAIAGIGHPERFFDTLKQLGFKVNATPLADHAAIQVELIERLSKQVLLMTEKDAVKCTEFENSNCWMLCVDADFEQSTRDLIKERLSTLL